MIIELTVLVVVKDWWINLMSKTKLDKCKLTEEVIEEFVMLNYPVLLGFDLSEGKITFKEWLQKCSIMAKKRKTKFGF